MNPLRILHLPVFPRFLLLLVVVAIWPIPASGALREVFLNPPEEAKPRGYWVWPHGNFDYRVMREGLAEFKAKGLGGMDIFDLGIRDTAKVIPSGPGFMSPEQVDGIAFALAEAKRLGLKMGLIVSSSWNAGGTWTPPEFASMNLVAWSETNTGPQRYQRALPFPELPASFRKPYGTFPLHVPRDEQGRPGWTYQAGTHINTHLTWWPLSDQLHAYLARCSALLMQGLFVADVAYYSGNDIPNFAKPKHLRPGLDYGYDYDDLNTEMLLQAKAGARGRIVLPSGMSYAALVLPAQDRRMDLAVLRHVERLVRQGITVIGLPPERTYGLRGFPHEEKQLRELAARMWGETPSARTSERKHGRGRVVAGKTERDVMRQLGLGPDFDVSPADARTQIDFIHRRTPREDIYFLRNVGSNDLRFDARFRVRGSQPELWDPVRGTMTPTAIFEEATDGTLLPLHLRGHGSLFVVFTPGKAKPHITAVYHQDRPLFPQNSAAAPTFEASRAGDGGIRFCASAPGSYQLRLSDGSTRVVTLPPDLAALDLSGSWEVRFPRGWDVPVRQEFATLHSWTDATNVATRSFSGIAVYAKLFELPAEKFSSGQRVLLDLGEVREVARVYLNGREAGLSSFTPHLLDVTGLVRPGENSLLIEVANTWLNRLIVDDALPEAQRKTHTNIPGPEAGKRWRNAQPRPSGLLGPVQLRFPQEIHVNLKQR